MAMQTRLYSERIPSPKGGRVWDTRLWRRMVASDIYRPHTQEEIAALLTPEVAACSVPRLSSFSQISAARLMSSLELSMARGAPD